MLLITTQQDVQTAFDSMPRQLMEESVTSRRVCALDVGLHMQELTAEQARITLPHAGTKEPFEFSKGGKQGGIETPDLWRTMLDHVLCSLAHRWGQEASVFDWSRSMVSTRF
jgi:hypothetical protein